MTCQSQRSVSNGPHYDWLFYVLYHDDFSFVRQIISTSVKSIQASFNSTPELMGVLEWFGETSHDSMHVLRAKLVLLLDQDESTRRVFTVFSAEACPLRHPLSPQKADQFYCQIHDDVIPQWVSNENITLNSFIGDVRMAYLIS